MPIIQFTNAARVYETESFPIPWDQNRRSIFEFVQSADSEADLPDEDEDQDEVSFAAGAFDGIGAYHMGREDKSNEARKIAKRLRSTINRPDKTNLRKFYKSLLSDSALSLADSLIDEVSSGKSVDIDRLKVLWRWVLMNAPDRAPVKLAIAMLGMFQTTELDQVFLDIGKHEEFTLYAAVALVNCRGGNQQEADAILMNLAKSVDGWGRIHTVERLFGTKNPDIKDWLLREGYKNSIMYEYLAHGCAVAGDLKSALQMPHIDDELMDSASDILSALWVGGPAADIGDYPDAPIVVELFLDAQRNRPIKLRPLLTAAELRKFLTDEEDERHNSWSKSHREKCSNLADQILRGDEVSNLVTQSLNDEDESTFWQARKLAQLIEIDWWPVVYQRQQNSTPDQEYWGMLMDTDDLERIDKVLELAENVLPLDKIGTGPSLHSGFGEDYMLYSGLDFIVQYLGEYVGKGWKLIEVALRSPVIRHRCLATRALSDWGEQHWPGAAREKLERAASLEPDEETKLDMENVLAGRPIDDSI